MGLSVAEQSAAGSGTGCPPTPSLQIAPHTDEYGHPTRVSQEIHMGRATTTTLHPCAAQPRAPEPEGDRTRLQKAKDGLRALLQRPSSGRTTSLGRRVEKPGTGRQSGPSGQTDSAQHDRGHTNK
jgi:hypothetical protein